jgi:hypothetical protein
MYNTFIGVCAGKNIGSGAGGASWQEPQNTIHPFLLMGA